MTNRRRRGAHLPARGLLLALTCLALTACDARSATLSATSVTLPLVMLRAKGGDTVALNGDFGEVAINNRKFSPALTLDLQNAKLNRLAIVGSTGVHVKGGGWSASDVRELVLIQQADDVSFDGSALQSEGKAYGFRILDTSNITIKSTHIDQVFQAINSGRVKNATYADNTITASFNDGIVIYANQGLKIEHNQISGNQRVDKRHPDGIQFIYKAGDARHGERSSDVVIRNNSISGNTQGIFGGGIDRAEIAGNTVNIDHGNGIRIGDCTECRVADNDVSTLPGAARRASITLDASVVQCGNKVAAGAGKSGVSERPCSR